MNVLILNGSPRADGNTALLINAFKEGLWQDAILTQVDLFDILPLPCIACGACAVKNTCRFEDLDALNLYLQNADAIVWAVPVYNYSVPAPVKSLLDRFQRYYEAVEVRKENVFEKKNRPAVLLLSAGRSGLYSVEIIQKQIQNAGRYCAFELTQTIFASHTDTQPMQADILAQATAAAQQITS